MFRLDGRVKCKFYLSEKKSPSTSFPQRFFYRPCQWTLNISDMCIAKFTFRTAADERGINYLVEVLLDADVGQPFLQERY